ncbi:HEAT repeat domain-containing protein [Pedosphaera parvula]|uniref:PBS lyase HEAT domain protein repeat-containing protein n=1 Tax=Pedosphaera parvula (strain Ellin514) TaxID=320771 RepID=B9XCP7_PEDPL|nr:hypothetical protein [Pedosphaera parvula]EEF62243.1 hypothetical protein Cflav_PD4878 [Pedosphaera parvula Ellin514]
MAKQVFLKRWILIGVLTILAAIAVGYWRKQTYKGKLISTWFKECYSLDEVVSDRARQAVYDMGVRSVPVIMELLQARDSRFKQQTIDWTQEHLPVRLWFRRDEEKQSNGRDAIGFLNPEARRVLAPELNQILYDTNHCKIAARALAVVGVEGIPHLNVALTNADESIRLQAVDALANYLSCTGRVTEIVVPNLCANALNTNQDFIVQYFAAYALRNINKRADITVPTLLQAVRNFRNYDPATSMYMAEIMEGVAQFGTNARVAIPDFVKALEDTDFSIRGEATNCLKRIDPEMAAKMGIQ